MAAHSPSLEKVYMLQDNYLYISHLDSDFQYWRLPVAPESISDTMQSTFSSTNALGRTAPVMTYSYSGPRTVNIALTLHRDMLDDANIGNTSVKLDADENYMDKLIKALQSVSLPKYNASNKMIEPPLVALRIGEEIFIKGIVSSDLSLTYKLPILSNGRYAEVSMSLTITEVDPYDATTVFSNGSFRGVVKTLRNGMGLGEGD